MKRIILIVTIFSAILCGNVLADSFDDYKKNVMGNDYNAKNKQPNINVKNSNGVFSKPPTTNMKKAEPKPPANLTIVEQNTNNSFTAGFVPSGYFVPKGVANSYQGYKLRIVNQIVEFGEGSSMSSAYEAALVNIKNASIEKVKTFSNANNFRNKYVKVILSNPSIAFSVQNNKYYYTITTEIFGLFKDK